MLDSNLLFSDAATVNANGNSSSKAVYKTGQAGVWIGVFVTAKSGTNPTLDVKVQESDNDSTYNDLGSFEQITAVGPSFRRVQSKKKYLRLAYTVGGTSPNFTVTAGVVSGPSRSAAA